MPILGVTASSIIKLPQNFDSLSTVTVGSGGSSSISFTSISSAYRHLQIRGIGRDDRSNVVDAINLRFNSDSGNNYAYHYVYGDGTSSFAGVSSAQSSIQMYRVAGSTATSNGFGGIVIDIADYANTNKNKTIKTLGGYDDGSTGQIWFTTGLWVSTSAVTSISITPAVGTTFSQYTTFALYGIKGI